MAALDWRGVRQYLLRQDPGTTCAVHRTMIAHPRAAGAILSIGLPVGQSEDWRFPPSAQGDGLHVQGFGDSWRAHIDRIHPEVNPIGHLLTDVLRR